MPRYKGTCGCYNRHDARELGLVPAIVWNDMLDRSEHFDANPMWYDQKDAAERLGIPERTMYRAVDVLVEAGRITKKKGYRPGTTTSTTWITINEESDVAVPGTTDLAVPRSDDLAVPILKETKEKDTDIGTASSGTERIKPAQLYSRIHSFFGGRHDRRKAMVAAIDVLQTELSDETIILGCQEIAAHPTFKTKEGNEITWTLSMLLLRDAAGLDRTADILLRAADKREAREKKESKEKKVKYSTEECY